MPSHITSALYCHCCCTKGAPRLCWRKMAFWTQLGLLLWKNFTYRRRQTVSISQRGFWGLSCSPVGWSSAEWGNVMYLNVLPLVVPGRATGSAFGKTGFKLKRVVGGQKPEGSKVIKTSVLNPNMRESQSTETLMSDQAERVYDCHVQQGTYEMKTCAMTCSALQVGHCQTAGMCAWVQKLLNAGRLQQQQQNCATL